MRLRTFHFLKKKKPVFFRSFLGMVSLLGGLALPFSGFSLDEVTYKGIVDKNKVNENERLQYLIMVQYPPGTMAPTITPPSFEQFRVLDEYQTLKKENPEGGQMYYVLKKSWLLQPSEIGKLSIASATVTYQDPTSNLLKNGRTDVIFIQVQGIAEAIGDTSEGRHEKSALSESSVWIWMAGLLLGVGAGAGILLWKRRKLPVGGPDLKPRDPGQVFTELGKALEWLEKEDVTAYGEAVTRLVLDELQFRLQVDAYKYSTAMLLEKCRARGVPEIWLEGLRDFFTLTDKIKFGGYDASEDEIYRLHEWLKAFFQAGKSW